MRGRGVRHHHGYGQRRDFLGAFGVHHQMLRFEGVQPADSGADIAGDAPRIARQPAAPARLRNSLIGRRHGKLGVPVHAAHLAATERVLYVKVEASPNLAAQPVLVFVVQPA